MDYDENGDKMEEEVALEDPWTSAMRRKEQDLVDRIINGEESGHYFVLLGPKVCTSTRILQSKSAQQSLNRDRGKVQ